MGNVLKSSFQAAVESGDLPAVREALATIPDVNVPLDGQGMTALHHAATKGHTELVQLLLQVTTSVNCDLVSSLVSTCPCLIGPGLRCELSRQAGRDAITFSDLERKHRYCTRAHQPRRESGGPFTRRQHGTA